MKRVSLHVDYDTIHEFVEPSLTPALFAQRIAAAASALGHPGGVLCYAEWGRFPASTRDSFEAEGWRWGEPLTSALGWRTLRDEVARDAAMAIDRTIVVVTANKALAAKAGELRQAATELVLWFGRPESGGETGWDRVDSLARILGLGEDGIAAVVDVQGLVASSWTLQTSVDVDSLVERIERALGRMGHVTWRTALADWHTLPVMRNKAGEPITHEAEALFRKAGYLTPMVPPMAPRNPLPDEATKALERLSFANDLVVVGHTEVALSLARVLEPRACRIHLWCDERPDVPSWILWQRLGDELAEPAAHISPLEAHSRTPGLWSRMGLFADRAMAEAGGDSIGEGDLVSALAGGAAFVRRADQALALVRSAASRGTLVEVTGESRGGKRYRINEDDPGLALMREITKALLEILGDGPGEGTGVPVSLVLDRLLARSTSGVQWPADRRVMQAWLGFLVDEGLLVRFKDTLGEGGEPRACLAFSPSPLKGVEIPAPSAGPDRGRQQPQKSPQVRVPPRLREHLIVAVDNYAVRHGRPVTPLAAVRKSLAEYGGASIEAAVKEAARAGDLQPLKAGSGNLSLNHQSKFVRLIVGRKNRAVAMLKRMAPMGQPIGEGRIRSALVESLKIRDEDAVDLITMLLKDRMLRRETQIVTSDGLSYTLSMDDPAVMRAQEHVMSHPGRGRFGPERPRGAREQRGGRGQRPRERRRP